MSHVQDTEIWPYKQRVYAQPSVCLGELDTQISLGFWRENGSPYLTQETRSYNDQQKRRNFEIVDFAVPADHRVKLKGSEKKDKIPWSY